MNVLWSSIGEETEYVLAFPGIEGRVTVAAAALDAGTAVFRLITANTSGREPVLFTRGQARSVRLYVNPASGGSPANPTEVSFEPSLIPPSHVQLFLAQVRATGVTFEVGPRIDWPTGHGHYDPRQTVAIADVIRTTSAFREFVAAFEGRRTRSETIFVAATPLSTDGGAPDHLRIAPAFELWPELALSAKVRMTRTSNRTRKAPAQSTIAEQFGRVIQPFQDSIEIDVTGDAAVAKRLALVQVRRQSVAREQPLARAEPEIDKIVPRKIPQHITYELDWQTTERRHVAKVHSIVTSRGDLFFLVLPDATLEVQSLQGPNGRESLGPTPADGFQRQASAGRSTSMVAWRHDGQSLRAFITPDELRASSEPYFRGLVDDALENWTQPLNDHLTHGLWQIAFESLEAQEELAAIAGDLISRITNDSRHTYRPLISRHSPFVVLAALARWRMLDRLAANNNWKAAIGNDERSIERLLSPITEWIAQQGATSQGLVAPVEAGSDVAADLLQRVSAIDRLKVSFPPPRGLLARNEEASAAIGLLLLQGEIKAAEQVERIGVALTLGDATDPRVRCLIAMFAGIFSGLRLEPEHADFALYRAALTVKDGSGDFLSNALYRGSRSPGEYFTAHDLNGGSLESVDAVDTFYPVFKKLKETFNEVSLRASRAATAPLEARVKVAASTSHVSMISLAETVADLHAVSAPTWDRAKFIEEIQLLSQPGAAAAQDHARQMLVADWLLDAQSRLNERALVIDSISSKMELARDAPADVLRTIISDLERGVGAPFVLPTGGLVSANPSNEYDPEWWMDNLLPSLEPGQRARASKKLGFAISTLARSKLKRYGLKVEAIRSEFLAITARKLSDERGLADAARALRLAWDRFQQADRMSLKFEMEAPGDIYDRHERLRTAIERADTAIRILR